MSFANLTRTPSPRHVRRGRLLPVAALVLYHLAAFHAAGQGKPGENKGPTSTQRAAEGGSNALVAFADRWDFNHDGIYTCGEWRIFITKVFRQADKDGNGSVAKAEFATVIAADKAFTADSFDFFDVDDDGKISRAEMVDRPNPIFPIYDNDRDCVVKRADIAPATGQSSQSTKSETR
nr:hypothetical protein [Rhizobium sp. ACO-34A]